VDEPFMTLADIASILKLNQQTVRNWLDAGLLPCTRVGRRVLIRRSAFDSLIDAGYNGPPTHAKTTPSFNVWEGEIPPPGIPS
jgi:excisionase family DNA binding protein